MAFDRLALFGMAVLKIRFGGSKQCVIIKHYIWIIQDLIRTGFLGFFTHNLFNANFLEK